MSAPDASSLPGLSDTRLQEIETLGITAEAYGDPIDHDNGNVAECTRCKIGVAFSDLLAEVRRLRGIEGEKDVLVQGFLRDEAVLTDRIARLEAALASAREETAQAVRDEREACVDLASSLIGTKCSCDGDGEVDPNCRGLMYNTACEDIIAAIRSRSLPGETADA